MPKFIVTERVPCVQVWTYEITARSEKSALEMIENGKTDIDIESVTEEHDYEQAQYEVERAR
jgi:hypothetical protein